jgi:hypothetical protein
MVLKVDLFGWIVGYFFGTGNFAGSSTYIIGYLPVGSVVDDPRSAFLADTVTS